MFTLNIPTRDERGFTLIELLVVIIVIGILAAIAIPLFLDQRKLAVDASVKSDVRNTATQVQTWLAQNPGSVATDATDYAGKGGNVSKTNGDTVNLSVATDGSYLVCGYAGTAAKQYTASTAAYVFDSTSGKFGLGSCTGGIVGGGSPAPSTSTSTPAAPAAVASYDFNDGTAQGWSGYSGTTASIVSSPANSGNALKLTGTPTTYGTAASPSITLTAGSSYTLTAYVYLQQGSTAYIATPQGGVNTNSVTTTGSWQQVTATFTAPSSGPTTIYLLTGTKNVSVTMYLDDFSLIKN